jgi:hypothetical protein
MAIVNRDKDASEQLYVLSYSAPGVVAVSATLQAALVPSAGQLLEFKVAGQGLSGAPFYNVQIQRWTSAGLTVIDPGGSVTMAAAFGVSGSAYGATYAAASSLAALQAGDILAIKSGGANTASTGLVAAFVIKATQDIKKSFDI